MNKHETTKPAAVPALNGSKSYQTADLALAALLVNQDQALVSLDRTDERRALFVFNNSPAVIAIAAGYWNGSILVEPRTYFEAIKFIKSRLYAPGA